MTLGSRRQDHARSEKTSTWAIVLAGVSLAVSVVSAYYAGRSAEYTKRQADAFKPRLNIGVHYEKQGHEFAGFVVMNNGLGMAIVDEMKIYYDGVEVGTWENLTLHINQNEALFKGLPTTITILHNSSIRPTSDEIRLYSVPVDNIVSWDKTRDMFAHRIDVKIKYCSIYSECEETCRFHRTCENGTL